jgi:alcohol dehydrogenase class IV
MRFEFAIEGRIVFGVGLWEQIGKLASTFGQQALLATNQRISDGALLVDEMAAQGFPLKDRLAAAGVGVHLLGVPGEPSIPLVKAGVEMARQAGCDVVIGVGGGSAMDAAKAISALLTNGGEPLDYLEVIGRGQPITRPAAPCIAVPTTAGTGAEVTRNAVLTSPDHQVKVSLRSRHLAPRLALIDPMLAVGLSPRMTAVTGLDALTQVIEPFTSVDANPLGDAVCREGMIRAARSLRQACRQGDDLDARTDMAVASLCGGLALANARLGIVHGFAGPVGGMFHAPHGAVCAALLAPAILANIQALEARQPGSPFLTRYTEAARILTGMPNAGPMDAAAWVQDLVTDLDIPSLGAWGVTAADFPAIVDKTLPASSTRGNPIVLTPGELMGILAAAL